MAEKRSPGQNGKVFGQAFFKKLAGEKRGRRPLLCSAVCCVVRNAKQNQKRKANKIPCQPKQRSVFWRSPVHKAPPGRQKSEREFCLFGGFFLRPACRAMWRAGRSCVACRCCGGFCAWHPRHFSAGVPLSCPRLAGSLLLLRLVWPVLPGSACRLPAVRFVCARIFSLSFAFSCLTFASQNSFHLSLRPRRASTFFRKESRQRFARGAARRSPSNPSDGALRLFSPSLSLLAGLAALRPQTAG